jgi:hypothetical protein
MCSPGIDIKTQLTVLNKGYWVRKTCCTSYNTYACSTSLRSPPIRTYKITFFPHVLYLFLLSYFIIEQYISDFCKAVCILTNKRESSNSNVFTGHPQYFERICFRFVQPNHFKFWFNYLLQLYFHNIPNRFTLSVCRPTLLTSINFDELNLMNLILLVLYINCDQT